MTECRLSWTKTFCAGECFCRFPSIFAGDPNPIPNLTGAPCANAYMPRQPAMRKGELTRMAGRYERQGNLQVRLMLQFLIAAKRNTKQFHFEALKPNASSTDLCGEGLSRRKFQQSVNRGFFYVWAVQQSRGTTPVAPHTAAQKVFPRRRRHASHIPQTLLASTTSTQTLFPVDS